MIKSKKSKHNALKAITLCLEMILLINKTNKKVKFNTKKSNPVSAFHINLKIDTTKNEAQKYTWRNW